MGDLRKSSEDLQAKVVNLQRESGVYSLGTIDAQGREQAYSGVLDRLQQSTLALTAAEQNRILKGAIAHAAENGDAEMLSGLAGNGMVSNPQAANSSFALLQGLRQQEATQQAALQEAEAKFGSSYPKLAELRGNIGGLEAFDPAGSWPDPGARKERLCCRGPDGIEYSRAVYRS